MSKLVDNVNSNYVRAGNALQSKSKPEKITVYVESEEDIAFWGNIFEKYRNKNREFDIKVGKVDVEVIKKLAANTEFKDCLQFIQIQQDIEKIYS